MDASILKTNDSIIKKVKASKIFLELLKTINEPDLETLENETYRFLIVGPWGNINSYRINESDNEYSLLYKQYLKEVNTIEVDSLGKELKIILKAKDWNAIKDSLESIHFWKLPVTNNNQYYLDGTGFVIEGYSNEKNVCTNKNYHITSRTSPNDTTRYSRIFDKVLALTTAVVVKP